MFGWFGGGRVRQLQKAYGRKLVEARDAQRNGDIVRYSKLIAESEKVLDEIGELSSRPPPALRRPRFVCDRERGPG